MKKICAIKIIFILLFLSFVTIIPYSTAYANPELRTSIMPIPDYAPRRGGANLGGITSGETGIEYTFPVNNGTDEGVVYYGYCVAVLDGTHPNGAADTMYDNSASPDSKDSLTYTFYLPGTYCLYVYRYDANMNPVMWTYGSRQYEFIYKQINIREGDNENALMDEVTRIAQECQRSDDYHTALAINTWLCDHVEYDQSYTYYSPEEAIFNGRSVCNGYSRAFELIAEKAGLQARRVVSNTHAWNAVLMDGDWYYVDSTWDDSSGSHRYFGMNQEIMDFEPDHAITNVVGGAVQCTELADSYYIREGVWERLAQAILPTMNNLVNNRSHIFSGISMGNKIYIEWPGYTTTSEAQRFANGQVTAYAFSHRSWTCTSTGETFYGDFHYDYNSNSISGELYGYGTLTLPDGLKVLDDEALAGVSAYYVIIPDGTESIGADVFTGSNVWEVRIPDSVTDIDQNAFAGTNGLVVVTPGGSAAEAAAIAQGIAVVTE